MKEGAAGHVTGKGDGDPVAGSDPPMGTDGPFHPGNQVPLEVIPAEMETRVALEDDGIPAAAVAPQSGHPDQTFIITPHKVCRAMPISAEAVRNLQENDLTVLHALERLMKRYQWVPLEVLTKATGMGEKEVTYRLTRLLHLGMAKYEKTPYDGYSLVFTGYDALALHALSGKGTVSALGPFIGEGKESIVYEGLGLGRLVLKFHRVGQRSFQSARLKRGYMPEEGHVPWLFASTFSAEREFLALTKLHPRVSVPVPIDRNRHVVVMSLIPGAILSHCTPEDPRAMLDAILLQVKEAYRLGVVHANLSEFNVMVDGETCFLIDWPQWMEATHQNAGEILERDLRVILLYFARKFGIEYPLPRALSEVTG